MEKKTTLREDKVLKEIKNTFPTYSFGQYVDLARLIQPHFFKYKNRDRLERDFTEEVKQNFDDMKLIIPNLNNKRQSDIFTSYQFNSLVKIWLKHVKTITWRKEQDNQALHYASMLKIALTGIRDNMPSEFKESIDEYYMPLMKLLEAISKTSKSDNTIFDSERSIEGRDFL